MQCKCRHRHHYETHKSMFFMFIQTIRSHHLLNQPLFKSKNFSSLFAFKSREALATQEETYSSSLQQCAQSSGLHRARAIHANLIKRSLLVPSLFLQNHLLNAYVKCGHLLHGLQLFDEMPEPNVVSWSAIIAGFVQNGSSHEALSMFRQMHVDGIKPNEFTFVSALNACSFAKDLALAFQIYALIVQLGFEWNVFLMNALLTVLVRHDKMAEALAAFERCPCKDTVSWNAMLAGYLQFSYSEVPGFWCRMICEGVKPDHFTYASVLTGLAVLLDWGLGVQVHGQLVKTGHGAEMCVANSLVDMYLKNQNLVDGLKAFGEMPCKDVVSWTQMAAGCLQCEQPGKALEIIDEMKRCGMELNKFTLATAVNACANLASLDEGRKHHGLRIKLGDDVDVCVDNALLDMYSKCGCMDSAMDVFSSMKDHSIVSWTTMIMGYSQNGNARTAIKIFDEMRVDGMEPNYVTFVCVLGACSQGGFVDEGWKYFSSMSKDHGISPGVDHYACMVDLLGRAGQIKEAEQLILNMPVEPSLLVWQTLLSFCQIHGDTETGLRTAKQALQIDRESPLTYVLLSNMFACENNWRDVGMLRDLMETREVQKMPGSSWIGTS